MVSLERPSLSCKIEKSLSVQLSSETACSGSNIPSEGTRYFQSSYYDLPLAEGAPDYEKKIYQYLKFQDVEMSHPSMKGARFLCKSCDIAAETRKLPTKQSCLLTRRKSRISTQTSLEIQIPLKYSKTN